MATTSSGAETARTEHLAELLGERIVLDLRSPYVFVGLLVETRPGYLILDDADAHDLRDTSTTRDRYVRECREHGLHANRRRVWVRLDEVVALSRLEDVLLD